MSALIKFKDGDEVDSTLESVIIEPVSNGYVVNCSYDDGEIKEVFIDKKEMLEMLKDIL